MIKSKIEELLSNINNYDENKLSAKIEKDIFKLPITYLSNKFEISEIIKLDLELNEDISKCSIYNYILNPKSKYSKLLVPLWNQYYTNNIEYLNDTIYLIKNFKHINNEGGYAKIKTVDNICIELRNETGFYEKYKYIDNKYFHSFNNCALFLQALTIYNLTSPMLGLLFPILILIVPFFILKFRKIEITFETYILILIDVIKRNSLGQALSEFSSVGLDRKIVILTSVIFYIFNIYQNFITCRTFYLNIFKIKDHLLSINDFIIYSINSINNLNKYCKKSYIQF